MTEKPPTLTGKKLERLIKKEGKAIQKATENFSKNDEREPEAREVTIPEIERATIRVQGNREAHEIINSIEETKKAVGEKRKEFEEETRRETTEEAVREDVSALEETIQFLRTAAIEAQQKGEGDEAKKYGEAIIALGKKARNIGKTIDEGARYEFRPQSDTEEQTGSIEKQLEDHDLFDADTLADGPKKEPSSLEKVKTFADEHLHRLHDDQLDVMGGAVLLEHARREQKDGGGNEAAAASESELTDAIRNLDDEQLDALAEALRDEAKKRNEIDRYDEETRKINLEHEETLRAQLRDQELEEQAMPLLRELAARNRQTQTQDMTPEDWEKFLNEGRESSEQEPGARSIEDLTRAVAEVGAARDRARQEQLEVVQADISAEERAGILERLGKGMDWYRNLPTWKKVGISVSLLGLGGAGVMVGGPAGVFASAAALLTGRTLSGLGAAAATQAYLERQGARRRTAMVASITTGALWAIAVPSVMHYVDEYFHINEHLREWFGMNRGGDIHHLTGNKGDRLIPLHPEPSIPEPSIPEPTITAPPAVIESLFGNPIEVTDQDRLRGLWGILSKKLTEAHIIDSSTPTQKINYMVDLLEDKLKALGPDELKRIGFASGNINVIHTGERLDLSSLEKWITSIR